MTSSNASNAWSTLDNAPIDCRCARTRSRLLAFTLFLFAALSLVGSPVHAQDWIYTARPGDNIWNLTERHLKSIGYWQSLQRYNNVQTPRRILPGTRLRIPIRWLKVQPASARVVAVDGEVERLSAEGGSPVAAKIGDELVSGAGVRTADDASASIEFADGSRLLVQSGTELVLDSMSAYGTTGMVDTRMRLQRGRVESEVEPAAGEASRYQIITPSAVVAVRGTRFRTAYDDTSSVALGEVSEGTILASSGRSRRTVKEGFGIRAEAGKRLAQPKPLLQAPSLDGVRDPVDRLLMELEWPAVDDAAAYRVQLFQPGTPPRLIVDRQVDGPRIELDAPPDGEYLLRVRGIDAERLEGIDGERRITVDARPVPPSLLEPAAEAKLHGAPPTLWWSTPSGIDRFHVQIARDAAFGDLLLDEPALGPQRFTLAAEPPPGTYYWRAASIDASGERGPFGDARSFRVLAVPAAVSAESAIEDERVVVSWGKAANAAGYEFQLARDAEFTDLLRDETVSDTRFELTDLEPDVYYFRARGVSDEGVKGPYSPTNQFEIQGEPWSPAWLLMFAPLLILL